MLLLWRYETQHKGSKGLFATFSVMTVSIYDTQHNNNALCRMFLIMLNAFVSSVVLKIVIMLSVMAPLVLAKKRTK